MSSEPVSSLFYRLTCKVHSGTDPIVHFFAHFFVWYIIILYLCLQKLESVCLEKKERRAERGFTT